MQIHTYSADTNYSAELTGAEILKKGKVYVAVSKNDERIEDVGGRQGAQLIVFGDPNSKRAVKYLKMISVSYYTRERNLLPNRILHRGICSSRNMSAFGSH